MHVFAAIVQSIGLPAPETEYRFARPRRWAFDYAWPAQMIALEVEGGIYGCGKRCRACGRRSVGGHTSIQRLKSDMEKYNEAAMRGWCVLRVTPEMVSQGDALAILERAFLPFRVGVQA